MTNILGKHIEHYIHGETVNKIRKELYRDVNDIVSTTLRNDIWETLTNDNIDSNIGYEVENTRCDQ